ncbi:hypothetical protein OOT46_08155 [Aquabacterium sp. A7-Y]|uniref:hypothetical protein n=1 Tax=Aquabacterium sp. A7-Y TaxID=1349605 RepID=UPI00223D7117|nr:hypothetical protein [Aquabacterium sp. A7-Y]MCW7537819.1 hypothetical protein [Aquabacterium sp. A7-Y]
MQPSRTSSESRTPSSARAAAPEDAGRQLPPGAAPGEPERPDVSDRPEAAVGHYGAGYGDPTRHLGGTAPGTPDAAPREGPTSESGKPGHKPQPR